MARQFLQQLRPTEVLELMPELTNKFNWTKNDLGYLVKLGLVKGTRGKNLTLINVPSLLELIDYKNKLIDSIKINR